MQIETYIYRPDKGWNKSIKKELDSKNTLLILFSDSAVNGLSEQLEDLKRDFSNSYIVGCSTAGEVYEDELNLKTIVLTIIKMECSHIRARSVEVKDDIVNSSKKMIEELTDEEKDLKAVFVLSDGLSINGSSIIDGINKALDNKEVIVTGALSGDGDRFNLTWVIVNGEIKKRTIVAVGFYGKSINVSCASKGGWSRFGIERVVTKSKGNVLYELDEKPALQIYKRYLGEYAKSLPASGLLFPLQVRHEDSEPKVRTIVSVDEKNGTITYAGDIKEGSFASFMKTNLDRLISGAEEAVFELNLEGYKNENALLIAVSCVGRRLVLGQRSEDELEVIREAMPATVKMVGFYSYGEISTTKNSCCDLLNQTMSLTFLWEKCKNG